MSDESIKAMAKLMVESLKITHELIRMHEEEESEWGEFTAIDVASLPIEDYLVSIGLPPDTPCGLNLKGWNLDED